MILAALVMAWWSPQTTSASKAGEPIRLIRAEVGSKGTPKGDTFVIEEQRDAFDLAKDKEVIVAFEWDGPPGTHRCELSWIAPDGSIGLQTRLDLTAKGRRFSGYWSLLLSATMAPGLWAAEVKVDGAANGSRTFRVVGVPAARLLRPDEIYKLASESTLLIEARLPQGAEPRSFSGFAIGEDAIVTTFGAINAAQELLITFADGSRAKTDEVWLSSRALDWALLKVPVPNTQRRLPVGEAAKVGDTCAFLNIAEGQKELAPCSVLGVNTSAPVRRLTVSNRPSQAAFGGPLLNASGQVIGMIGADSQPGGAAFEDAGGALRVGTRLPRSALLVMPVDGIHRSEDPASFQKLASFWERGLFIPLVTASRYVRYGFLSAGASNPSGDRVRGTSDSEFSARDGVLTALLQWEPPEKIEGLISHRCYDMSNRLLVEGKPRKATLRPGTLTNSSTQVDIAGFTPGDYRLDILFGQDVAWRGYFRIKP